MPTATKAAPAKAPSHKQALPDTTGSEVRRLVDETRARLLDEALRKVDEIEDVLWQAKLHLALTIRDVGIANTARLWGVTQQNVSNKVIRIEKAIERREAEKRGGA